MKKARIMLMAIAVLGVIGGTLAFKAAKFHPANIFCYTGTVNAKPVCAITSYQSVAVELPSTTAPCLNIPNVGTYSTVYSTTTLCTLGFTTGTVYTTVQQ